MSYDCFISYASIDIDYARGLHRRLTDEGLTVWFDRVRLLPGFDWHAEVEQGCENSRVVLPVLTPSWKESEWTRFETYGAEAVIPLVYEGAWAEVATPPLERFQAEIFEVNPARNDAWPPLLLLLRERLMRPPLEKTERVAHIQYLSNPHFVGRDQELLSLHEALHGNPRATLTQGRVLAITALGGVGKSNLARQYVEKFWRCYSQILWVDCRHTLASEFARIHDLILSPTEGKEPPEAAKAARAMRMLEGAATRLLILDNAEDEDSVRTWIPKTGGCHTLITSRFAAWSATIGTASLDVLSPDAAVALLRSRSGHQADESGDEVCGTLAERLGYLPLALEQAAAYIEQQGPDFGFDDYLRLYEETALDLLAQGVLGATEYPDSVVTTWRSTIEKLHPGARAILRLCSFLSATVVPVKMIVENMSEVRAATGVGGEADEGTPSSEEFGARAEIGQLSAYSMVKLSGREFAIHPLVLTVERISIPAEERPDWLERSIRMFLHYAPGLSDKPETWPIWNGLSSHAVALHVHATEASPGLKIKLLDRLARFFFGKAEYLQSLEYERLAFEVAEETYGADDAQVEDRLINYGESLREVERYEEAERLFRRSLEWWVTHRGRRSMGVATALNYLGLVQRQRGNMTEAEASFREGLDVCEAIGREGSRTHVLLLMNLAFLLTLTGRAAEAQPLAGRAVEASGKLNEIVLKWWAMQSSGIVDFKIEEFVSAARSLKQAYKGFEAQLGPDHPYTLTCLGNLIRVLIHTEDDPEVDELLDKIKTSAGSTGLALELNNVALEFRKTGNLLRSEKCFRLATSIDTGIRGSDHPKIAHRLCNLITVLASQGKFVEARKELSRAWRIMRATRDLTTARILLMRMILAGLEKEVFPDVVGRMKSLLIGGSLENAAEVETDLTGWRTWVESLRGSLTAETIELVLGIARTVEDLTRATDLESFPLWRDQAPVALEHPWKN